MRATCEPRLPVPSVANLTLTGHVGTADNEAKLWGSGRDELFTSIFLLALRFFW